MVDAQMIAQLQAIVGPEGVDVEPEKLENFGHDETPLYQTTPEVVVHPADTNQVSRVVKMADEKMIPVTPRGGGTSLSGGAVPVHKGIVLALDRMNRIKEVDAANLMVVTEPGVITAELGKELARHGLFFPPDPVSLESCTIGGNVAECAGGPRAMKYGVTKNYVTGLEVVMADGEIVRYGGKLLKNVTGYDFVNLMVGSEGTLGIVTEITLEVLPQPKAVVDLLIPFNRIGDAAWFAVEIIRQGAAPAAIEFMDGPSIRLVEKFLARPLPFNDADCITIVELDGYDPESIRKGYEMIGQLAVTMGARDVLVGDNTPDREKIWEPRKKIGEALKTLKQILCREDLVVPKSRIPDLINRLDELARKSGAELYAFGHFGDGNIHTDFTVDDDGDERIDYRDDKARLDAVKKLRSEIYRITVDLGGTITAEHGIGLSKKDFLGLAIDSSTIEKMRQIKRIFDPKNILNPGKIFPD
jgi:glycolate oxidase